MKFGVLLPSGEDLNRGVDVAIRAEELGYDAVMVAEGHGVRGAIPQTLTVLAAVAARTQRVMLCPFTLLLPLHHPLEVAEQAAIVDVLSSGRLILGLASGSNPVVFAGFGISMTERAGRMEEGIPLLRRLLSGETVTHSGRHFVLQDAVIIPKPARCPQIWVGAWVEAAIRRAARLADCWAPGPTVDFATLERAFATYRDELRRLGKTVEVCPLAREVFCAPTARQARRGGEHILAYYQDHYFGSDHPVLGTVSKTEVGYDEFDRRFVIGDPQACIDAIARLQTLGVNYLIVRMHLPGVPEEDAVASMKLFMSKVAPHFAD